jgi:glycosyltransferase involved in cell wall biosynthesis
MRVTHVITRLIVGGAQENTVASVLGLRRIPGLEVDLISGPTAGPEGSLESSFADCPGLLRTARHLFRPVHPWHDALGLLELTRLLRERRPDVVHTHSGKAGVLGRLAARRAGVPIIVHTIHGPSFGPFQAALSNGIFTAAERLAAHATSHFVTVSEAMTRQYLAAGIGRPEQYTRIFSGFPLEPFLQAHNNEKIRARLGLSLDDFVVGKIARLTELKGHEFLFSAAPELIRRCPRLKFLLVGDGPWRGRFEQTIRQLGLQRHFVFTGLVPPESIPELVGIMDTLIHLSLREGLPRALPQALAAGKPVVATDCDGASEVCLDGQTGFLIPPRDSAALTQRLLQLEADPALRERLGRRGQEFVRERFSVERMVNELYQLYLRLAAEAGMTLSSRQ